MFYCQEIFFNPNIYSKSLIDNKNAYSHWEVDDVVEDGLVECDIIKYYIVKCVDVNYLIDGNVVISSDITLSNVDVLMSTSWLMVML